MINDVASIILWLIVAVFFLHVIEGDAQKWVQSKFTSAVGTGNLGVPFAPGSITGDTQASNFAANVGAPVQGFNQAK